VRSRRPGERANGSGLGPGEAMSDLEVEAAGSGRVHTIAFDWVDPVKLQLPSREN
jgi:hypothetical protein